MGAYLYVLLKHAPLNWPNTYSSHASLFTLLFPSFFPFSSFSSLIFFKKVVCSLFLRRCKVSFSPKKGSWSISTFSLLQDDSQPPTPSCFRFWVLVSAFSCLYISFCWATVSSEQLHGWRGNIHVSVKHVLRFLDS